MEFQLLSIATAAQLLPLGGYSRWSQFKRFCPFSKEKFRQLSLSGQAPQPIRMGQRCTFYCNQELHRFLSDPLHYSLSSPAKVTEEALVSGAHHD